MKKQKQKITQRRKNEKIRKPCYSKRERERERELYSNKIMKIEARIAFISDNKKQADYI